jgi:hypothetical protein
MATESSQNASITSVHEDLLVDSDGNTFGFVLSAYYGLQVLINNVVDTTTAEATMLLYHDHIIYYENENGNFYSKLNLSNQWRQTTDPRVAIPKQLSIVVPDTIIANRPFTISGRVQGYTITPRLQYKTSLAQATWVDLPASVSTIAAFQFVQSGLPYATGLSVTVRDKNITNVAATSHSLNLVRAPESEEGTALPAGSTDSIVDTSGNFWQINNDGFALVNGQVDTLVPEALMLYYSNHSVFYQSPQQAWYLWLPTKNTWQLTISPYINSPATTAFKIKQATESLQGLVSAMAALVAKLQPARVID